MRIYAGNLPYDVSEDELKQEFMAYGDVKSVTIPADKLSGRPKGFAFIEMDSKSEAEAAIEGINGKMLKNRTVVVNEARPRTENRGGGGGGSFGNRRGGGSSGGRGGGYGGGRQRRY